MVKPTRWLALIILYTLVTLAIAYAVPEDSPLVAVRFVVGFVFVVFVPGYCLINILFIEQNRLDPVEMVVLSVALSFGLAGLVGLFLGLSPIGMSFATITVSLAAFVLFLAVVAFLRKSKVPQKEQAQFLEQISL